MQIHPERARETAVRAAHDAGHSDVANHIAAIPLGHFANAMEQEPPASRSKEPSAYARGVARAQQASRTGTTGWTAR